MCVFLIKRLQRQQWNSITLELLRLTYFVSEMISTEPFILF